MMVTEPQVKLASHWQPQAAALLGGIPVSSSQQWEGTGSPVGSSRAYPVLPGLSVDLEART